MEQEKKSKYAELVFALKALESKIFLHASMKQYETVQSFFLIAVRKAKLENEISLIGEWNDDDIKKKKIDVIICAQNEIPNIVHVEKVFNGCCAIKFNYLRFMKFIEYSVPLRNDEKDNATDINNFSSTITLSNGNETTIKVSDLKFHVARYGADEYGRSIKLIVYMDEIVEVLLKSTSEEDHWTPDPNLFYLLDRVFGEYYMTKYITTVNFFPTIIMPKDTVFLDIYEAKENIDELLKLNHKHCNICNIPEYRTKLTEIIDINSQSKQLVCVNCK